MKIFFMLFTQCGGSLVWKGIGEVMCQCVGVAVHPYGSALVGSVLVQLYTGAVVHKCGSALVWHCTVVVGHLCGSALVW
jgi:hypothetical protein